MTELKLSDVVPVLRADLKIGEPTPGRGETTVTVSDPATGRETTVRGFELSIMRMLNGRRTAEEVLSAASQIGLPLSLDSLAVFIRRLRKEGFLGEPGQAPANLLSWEPRNEWNDEIRRLYQEALREARADRLVAAKSRLETLLARAPGTKEAQQLLHWVMERLRPDTGPKTPAFKEVYGLVEKTWFDEGERQSEANEHASLEMDAVPAPAVQGSRVPMFAGVGALAVLVIVLLIPFPRQVHAKVTLLPISQADATAPHAGLLKDVMAVGSWVRKGDVIAHYDTAPLEKRLKELDAQIAAADKKAKAPGPLPKKSQALKAAALKADALAKAAQADADKLAARLKGKSTPALVKAQNKAKLLKTAADAAQKTADAAMPTGPEQAKSELVALNAEKEKLKGEIQAASVIAPSGGQMVTVPAQAGQPVAAGAVVARLSDTSSLIAVMQLPPAETKNLKQGGSAEVKLPGFAKRVKVEKVEADHAEVTLDNQKATLKLDAVGEAELDGESKSILGRM
ncbi:MAG: HlyD family secretion protein [Myxococcaceae bacterium]